MRRNARPLILAVPVLALTGCHHGYRASPTAAFSGDRFQAFETGALGPSLVAGDALAFNIMLARGYDTPEIEGPMPEPRFAIATPSIDAE